MDPPKYMQLIEIIRAQYALEWHGTHGIHHWRRVMINGLHLAESTGADEEVVQLFAYLHDSRRLNESRDNGHGARAAEFIQTLQSSLIDLDESRLDLLLFACRHHTDGLTDGDVTVQTCWDSDRLDLGRVGIVPEPKYLCTMAAKDPEVIQWAYRRSRVW